MATRKVHRKGKASKASKASKRSKARRSPSKKSKKSNRVKRQRGGANHSLAQGAEFLSRHTNQHGGALVGSPIDYTGRLPDELRMAARVGGLDESFRAASGMSDTEMPQKGGRRARKSTRKVRKSKKSKKSKSKKSKSKKSKSKKSRSKKSKKSRSRQSGGARYEGAPLSQSPMLLSPSQAARAGTADFSNPLLR
jgi:hypothetical protein